MIPAVRQEKILDMLSSNEIVSTDIIMKGLNISVSTLRRDLVKLEREKKIMLLHGGGVRLTQKPLELSISTKLELNREIKEKIAVRAVALIEDGDVIFMDSSSTTYMMIPYLAGKNVSVVTNGISHIDQLTAYDIPGIIIGGSIKKTTNSCIGPIAENNLRTLFFNKCFLGASGFSVSSGITNHDINERAIKSLALKNSCQPYFLLDHTKFGNITLVHVANLDEYPVLTDELPDCLKGYDNFIVCG